MTDDALTPERREELRKLYGKASAGPYEADSLETRDDSGRYSAFVIYDWSGKVLCDTVNSDCQTIEQDGPDEDGITSSWDEVGRRNMAYFAAAANTAPALLSALDKAESRVKELEDFSSDAVRAVGEHVGMGEEDIAEGMSVSEMREALADHNADFDRESDRAKKAEADLAEAAKLLQEMLRHSCVSDAPDEDKFPEDIDAESHVRASLARNSGKRKG